MTLRTLSFDFVAMMLLGIAAIVSPCRAQDMPDTPADAFAEMPATVLFREGDDPAWAARDLDTAGWHEVSLTTPPARQGVAFDAPIGWYRIALPAMRFPKGGALQVQFDGLGGAVEAFMADMPLRARFGGIQRVSFGIAGERPVFPPPGAPTGFTIKAPHWSTTKSNVLCLRVTRAPRASGIESGTARMGFALWMSGIVHPQNRRLVAWENGALAACALGLLTALFMTACDRREAWNWWHAAVFLVIGLAVLIGGYALFFEGRLTHELMRLGWCVTALIPVCLLFLGKSVPGGSSRAVPRAMSWILSAMSAAAALLLMLARNVTTLAAAQWITVAAFVMSAIFLIGAARSSAGHAEKGTALFLITSAVLSVGWALHLAATQTGMTFFSRTALHMTVVGYAVAFYVLLVVRLQISRDACRHLLRGNLEAQEDERRRIARDLHDGVGQSMQSLKLRLQMDAQSSGKSTECEPHIVAVDACIQELRAVTAHLRAVFLGRRSLADALRALTEQFAAESNVRVHFESNVSRPVEARAEEHLFRILQEALTNATRHGHARQIDVHLHESGERLSLVVRDDGGTKAAAVTGGGSGIFNMRERAELLAGHLRIAFEPHGAEVRVVIPFPAA